VGSRVSIRARGAGEANAGAVGTSEASPAPQSDEDKEKAKWRLQVGRGAARLLVSPHALRSASPAATPRSPWQATQEEQFKSAFAKAFTMSQLYVKDR
jgi:hypothetical protein